MKKSKKIAILTFLAISKCDRHTKILWRTHFCEYTTPTKGRKGQKIDIISHNKISLSYGTIKVKIKDNNSLCSSKWSLSQIWWNSNWRHNPATCGALICLTILWLVQKILSSSWGLLQNFTFLFITFTWNWLLTICRISQGYLCCRTSPVPNHQWKTFSYQDSDQT